MIKIEVQFFYPLVYRVDIEIIPDNRKIIANSGEEVGSNEYLIPDLQEDEFEILFADFERESSLDDAHLALLTGLMHQDEALEILKARRT